MEVIKTMSPGSPGTRKYSQEWRDQLVAVRYRKDSSQNRIVTTIEIIVDQRALNDTLHFQNELHKKDSQIVYIRVAYPEKDLRSKVKTAGGQWIPHLGAWALSFGDVKALGLTERIL